MHCDPAHPVRDTKVSGHGPGLKSFEFLSACEKTPREQDKCPLTSVSSNHGIVLGMHFCAPPR